jgi:hypothetical protein
MTCVDGCECEHERSSVQKGCRKPVKANPVVFRLCNTALTLFQRSDSVETTANGCYDNLGSKKRAHQGQYLAGLVVYRINTDDMDS